jgi:threonyl-tRNA synthetase
MLYYKAHHYSYRDLPLRISEIGHVHRHEFSGALSGLFRVRSFHQDDAHVFMTHEQITDEILSIFSITNKLYTAFGLTYRVELSTRPDEGSIGTDADWEMTTSALSRALDTSGLSYSINPGDGAFYGPKIDFHITDALGRSWQCGTIQLDMSLPERFDLEYTDRDGTKKRPIMIHRALFGSIERFFGILVEHYAGKFPLWLSPRPVRLLPVAQRHIQRCEEIAKLLHTRGIEAEIDASDETMGKKVRLAQMAQVNYMLTIGDRECESPHISVRTRCGQVHADEPLEQFLERLSNEIRERKEIGPYAITKGATANAEEMR